MADRNINSLTFDGISGVRYVLDAGNVKYSDGATYSGGSVGKAITDLKSELDD